GGGGRPASRGAAGRGDGVRGGGSRPRPPRVASAPADENDMSGAPQYTPEVIEEYAARLYRRASSMGVGAAVTGAVVGAFFGAIPLTSLGDAWPIPSAFGFATLLVGVIAGGLIGWVVGDARGF